MRKILTTALLAWALWWVQELENRPEMPQDVVMLGVHETQAACEEQAGIRRQWQVELSRQEVSSFDWSSKPWPKYMLRRHSFTCIPT